MMKPMTLVRAMAPTSLRGEERCQAGGSQPFKVPWLSHHNCPPVSSRKSCALIPEMSLVQVTCACPTKPPRSLWSVVLP